MITDLTTPIADPYFSSSVPDQVFALSGARAVVVISVDGDEVYHETLSPSGGVVRISDMSSMLEPYARRRLVVSVNVTVSELSSSAAVSDTYTADFDVVFSRADVGMDADSFCRAHFLSILLGPKVTSLGRLEYLHYLGSDAATCRATYDDGTEATFTPTVSGGNNRYTTLDVSPSHYVVAGKTLLSYVISAGSRAQRYDLDLSVPDCAPILLFDNSFGVQELLYCTGTHKVSPEYKRQSARINGLLRNYDIEETRSFHADTGILTTAMANWADDLFRSREVYLVNIFNGTPTVGKEVVITDSKSEYDNDDETMPRFTFSYQYSQRIHNVLTLQRAGRIFDNTFDHTFE